MGRISVEAAVLMEMLRVLEERGDSAEIVTLMGYLVDGFSTATPASLQRPWDIATVAPELPPTVL